MEHSDTKGAAIMRAIHKDEIRHVEFGLHWLRELKDPALSDFEAWQTALHWPIRPRHAKGDQFQHTARREAGMDEDFIQQLLTWLMPMSPPTSRGRFPPATCNGCLESAVSWTSRADEVPRTDQHRRPARCRQHSVPAAGHPTHSGNQPGLVAYCHSTTTSNRKRHPAACR